MAASRFAERSGPCVPLPLLASAVGAALMPTSIGYQDFAALLARQPGVSERWREHLIASPFGTIHAATFSFALPLGTAMPRAARLATGQLRSALARREDLVGRRAGADDAGRSRSIIRPSIAGSRAIGCRSAGCAAARRPDNRRACRNCSRSTRRHRSRPARRRRTAARPKSAERRRADPAGRCRSDAPVDGFRHACRSSTRPAISLQRRVIGPQRPPARAIP